MNRLIPFQRNGKTEWRSVNKLTTQMGLGDAVAVVAEPIRKMLHIPECGGCKKRHSDWNKAVPNINPFARNLDNSAQTPHNPQPSTASAHGPRILPFSK